jgi:murein DD-endopeptidase MepM/ murein hydrolase activator NlpD
MAAPMLAKGAVLAATNPRKAGKLFKGVLGALFGLTLVAGFTGAALVGQASALLSAASGRPQVASCVDGARLAAGTAGLVAVFPLPDGTWSATSPCGQRVHPVFGTVGMHNGADFAAPDGTPLLSVFDGVVSRGVCSSQSRV